MQSTPACEPLTALPFNAPPAKLSMIIKSDTGTLQSRKRQKRKEVVLTDFYHSSIMIHFQQVTGAVWIPHVLTGCEELTTSDPKMNKIKRNFLIR